MNKIILLSKLENAVKKEFYKVNFDYLSEDLVKITIKNVDIYLFHIDKTFSIFNKKKRLFLRIAFSISIFFLNLVTLFND